MPLADRGRDNGFAHIRLNEGVKSYTVLRTVCRDCGESGDVRLTRGKTTISQEWAERDFRAKKWDLGNSRDWDRCPACVEWRKEQRAKARILEAVPQQQTPKQPAPSELGQGNGKEDRTVSRLGRSAYHALQGLGGQCS